MLLIRGALERLFANHHKSFFAAALTITRDRAAAEDAVHDALLAVASVKTQPDDLKAYVFRVIRNKAILYNKQSKRCVNEAPEKEFIATETLDNDQKIFVSQVLKQIEALEPNQQQVLIMKIFAELTFKEIAEIMECPMNTVASWYRRGMNQLQEKFDEHR